MNLRESKIGFIATVFNEEKNIGKLLDSLILQTVKPDKIIIVDGKSNDKTIRILKTYAKKFPAKTFEVISKKGNRSVGRNTAIKNCNTEIIAISDGGCVLDRNWLKEIITPFKKNKVDVVAGYYKGVSRNAFQEALIPYVLVMPDKVNPKNFLPATRSMAIRRNVFLGVGEFNELLSHNEDYEFAKRLKNNSYKIVFAKKAVVLWFPPKTIKSTFIMFFRFALGDIESGILRFKVVLLFIRFFIFLLLIFLSIFNTNIVYLLLLSLFLYFMYSNMKNEKYVSSLRGKLWLIFFQLLSDAAVISGSVAGIYFRK